MTSQPSRPNRFSEDHFRARKSSNLLGERRRERMERMGLTGAIHEGQSWVPGTEEVAKSPPSASSGPATNIRQ